MFSVYSIFLVVEWGVILLVLFTFLNKYVENWIVMKAIQVVFGESKKEGNHKSLKYPTEEEDSKSESNLFGNQIADPYQCLENTANPVSKKWFAAQKNNTNQFFASVKDVTRNIAEQIKASQNYEVVDAPFHHGEQYFFFKRLRPEHSQFSLFSTDNLNTDAQLIFDTSLLKASVEQESSGRKNGDESCNMLDNGSQVIYGTWFSDDGHKMAVGYSDTLTSSDMTIVVRDLQSDKDMSLDIIKHCSVATTSVSWLNSRTGFFYTTQGPHFAADPDVGDQENGAPAGCTGRIVSRVMFHHLGLLQVDDLMVYELLTDADNAQSLSTVITSDGHYLMIEIYKARGEVSSNSSFRSVSTEHCAVHGATGGGNKVHYFDLTKFDGKTAKSLGSLFKLVDTFSYRFQYISNIEEDFWFRTNYKAPGFRVVRISLPEFHVNYPAPTAEYEHRLLIAWKTSLEWIPERVKDGGYLEFAGIAAHTVLVLKYLINGVHEVLLYDLTSTLMEESQIPVADLPHPPFGCITGPNCNFYSSEIFYQFSDLGDPGSIYRAIIKRDVCSGSIEISFDQLNSTALPDMDKYEFETRQEFVPATGSSDNSPANKVPVLIFGTKSAFDNHDDNNAAAPCVLYTYSGFGVCSVAKFSLPMLVLAKRFNVLLALVNVQGSAVYGAAFNSAGTKANKQRAVDDLRNVMHFLVQKRYTTSAQLGVFCGGIGGLLASAVMTAHPGSFTAAVIVDGLFDLMKHHKFNPAVGARSSSGSPNSDSGADHSRDTLWYQEFGCAEESAEECARMLALSPLHRLNSLPDMTAFPATLLAISNTNSNNNVSFKHSLKFLAELQRCGNLSVGMAKPLLLKCLDCEDPLLLQLEAEEAEPSGEQPNTSDSNSDCDDSHNNTYTALSIESVAAMLAFLVTNIGAECNITAGQHAQQSGTAENEEKSQSESE